MNDNATPEEKAANDLRLMKEIFKDESFLNAACRRIDNTDEPITMNQFAEQAIKNLDDVSKLIVRCMT